MAHVNLARATRWTGTLFLRAAAEFARMAPDRAEWNDDVLRPDPPRLVRHRRLSALGRAFDVRPGFAALLDGSFLEHRSEASLDPVNEAVRRHLEPQFPDPFGPSGPLRPDSRAKMVYRRLAGYLVDAYALLAANDSVLMASGPFWYGVDLVGSANQRLWEAIEPVEAAAERFVDPEGRPRDLDELRELGWPDDDPWEIDLEWACG